MTTEATKSSPSSTEGTGREHYVDVVLDVETKENLETTTTTTTVLPDFKPNAVESLRALESRFGFTVDVNTSQLSICSEDEARRAVFSSYSPTSSSSKLPSGFQELLQQYTQAKLLSKNDLELELITLPLPSREEEEEDHALPSQSNNWKRATTIMASRGALDNPQRLLIVVPGLNAADGLWHITPCLPKFPSSFSSPLSVSASHSSSSSTLTSSTAQDAEEDKGSEPLSLIQASIGPCATLARMYGFGLVILNPNRSFRYRYASSTNSLEFEINFNSKPAFREEHLLVVGELFLSESKAKSWAILGHSAAGKTIIDWMGRLSERGTASTPSSTSFLTDGFLLQRLVAVALADATSLVLPNTFSPRAINFWRGDQSSIYKADGQPRVANWKATETVPLDAPMSLGSNTGLSGRRESFKAARCILRSAGVLNHERTIVKALEPMLAWLVHTIEDQEVASGAKDNRSETISSLASSSSSLTPPTQEGGCLIQ